MNKLEVRVVGKVWGKYKIRVVSRVVVSKVKGRNIKIMWNRTSKAHFTDDQRSGALGSRGGKWGIGEGRENQSKVGIMTWRRR